MATCLQLSLQLCLTWAHVLFLLHSSLSIYLCLSSSAVHCLSLSLSLSVGHLMSLWVCCCLPAAGIPNAFEAVICVACVSNWRFIYPPTLLPYPTFLLLLLFFSSCVCVCMTGMRLKLLLQLVVRTLLNTFEHFHAATLSLQPKIAFSGSCCCCCYFIDSNAKLQLQLQHTHTHRKKKSSNTACSERAQFSSSSLESFVLAGSWKVKERRNGEGRRFGGIQADKQRMLPLSFILSFLFYFVFWTLGLCLSISVCLCCLFVPFVSQMNFNFMATQRQ